MSIKLGNNNIINVYLGNNRVNTIYLGSTLVYSSTFDLLIFFFEIDTNTIILNLNGSNVSRWNDKSNNNKNAIQNDANFQPIYDNNPPRIIFNNSQNMVISNIPNVVGTFILGTTNGTAIYTINPTLQNNNNNYIIGRRDAGNMPDDGSVYGYLLFNTIIDNTNSEFYRQSLISKGAGNNYENITDFSNFWKGWSEIIEFPLIDTSQGTNFTETWYACSSLTTFPEIDTSNAITFSGTWQGCSSLTTFPLIDTSNAITFSETWKGCSSLTTFPKIDASKGTNFTGTWDYCRSLTTFPQIDISNAITFSGSWKGCSSLTTFPKINTSNATDFSETWKGCSSLTIFPLIDTSNAITFSETWKGCSSLTTFPLIDTSNAITFSGTWQGCSSLTTFPKINTPKGTNFTETWYACSSLTTFPLIDTSNAITFSGTWQGCSSLTTFPLIDTSNAITFSETWKGCSSLTTFPEINTSKGTNFTETWYACSSLTTFPANMFNNCSAIIFTNAFKNTNLTQTSIDNILVSINTNNTFNGIFVQSGGSGPSATGQNAIYYLRSRDWNIMVESEINIYTYQSSVFFFEIDTNTIILNGSNVSQWNDKSTNNNNAIQNDANFQPIYDNNPPRIIFYNLRNMVISNIPNVVRTFILGTTNGTAIYTINPTLQNNNNNNYIIGRRDAGYMPDDGSVYGYLLFNTLLNNNDSELYRLHLISKGAGNNYGNITDFSNFWRGWSEIIEFPLIDTSQGTNFTATWLSCRNITSFPSINTSKGTNFERAWEACYSLTSFPSIDTAQGTNFSRTWENCISLPTFPPLNILKGTNFFETWRNCSSLTTFPVNMFKRCSATNFNNAFLDTNLTQSSIDNILVSINSNNTSNGTFTQSGGSAPSATGQNAINNLRSRGWSITVTGGY